MPARELYAPDDAHAGPDRQRLDDVQGPVQPRRATRPAQPGATSCTCRTCAPRSSRSPSNDETAVCNLGSINLGRHRRRDRRRHGVRLRPASARVGAHRRAVPRPGDRHQLLPDRRRPRPRTPRWRPVGLGLMGLQDVFFQLRLPFDSRRGPRAVDADRRGDLLPRPVGLGRAGRGSTGRTRPSPRPAPPQGELQFDLWGVTPSRPGALGRAARAHRRARPAQLAADRHRPDRDDRLDRRLLRVHRAAGVEPVQARDAVGRVPADQRYLVRELQARGPVDRAEIRDAHQAGRGLGAGHRRASPTTCGRSTARRGSCRCGR